MEACGCDDFIGNLENISMPDEEEKTEEDVDEDADIDDTVMETLKQEVIDADPGI